MQPLVAATAAVPCRSEPQLFFAENPQDVWRAKRLCVGCPVQAFRSGSHVYATQFHPELDASGLCARIDVYKHAGYFDPAEADRLKALARRSRVVHPHAILRQFVQRYAEP